MRITILTFGSRGDVQPYVALGGGLARAGHQVRLATHASYRDLAAAQAVDFCVVDGNPAEILASELGAGWESAGRNPIAFVGGLLRVMEPLMLGAARQSWSACEDAELIVVSLLGVYAGRHVAERLGVPLVLAPYLPVGPTGSFPSPIACFAPGLGPVANWLTHVLSGELMWLTARGALNRVRREVFDLPPMSLGGLAAEVRTGRWPTIYGYSGHVVPRPRAWGDNVHVTGYWFLDGAAGWQPPPELADFLAAGPPPVYAGFGSMHVHDPETTATVVRALGATGQRGLLLTGPGGLEGAGLPDTVLPIGPCPHDWLFPRVAAAVHHGGAGTTAAALRAGVPSVVVPFFADQPFWGWRVAQLGAGPPSIPRRRLTAGRLTRAIGIATGDPAVRRRAADLGVRIRAEDGVARAVEAVERYADVARPGRKG